jgi:teichuronopeptide biosynthesis TupA-like protein
MAFRADPTSPANIVGPHGSHLATGKWSLMRIVSDRRKLGVVANIVGQLCWLMGTGKWPKRPGGDQMRGIDFYPPMDFVAALMASAYKFEKTHGYLPNLVAPSSFTEHLFVRKFFAPLPMPSLADKLTAREYVRARLGDDVLTPVVWVGDAVGELFTAELPRGRFVLKANHSCGANLFLDLPRDLSTKRDGIAKCTSRWLAHRFGYDWGEWPYCTFPRKLFLESFIDFSGTAAPDEYKFFCFNGKARLINFHVDRFAQHKSALYDPLWKQFPVSYGRELAHRPRPENLVDMVSVAETIAAGLEFARIDLYSDRKRIIKFGEITFTPGNALDRFSDFQFDLWLGRFFGNVT